MAFLWSVCLLVMASNAIPIGLQGGVGIEALNNFKDEALPKILSGLGHKEMPVMTKTVGHGTFTLTLQIRSLVLGDLTVNTKDSKVSFLTPDTIMFDLTQITGTAQFHWLYDTPLGGDGGIGRVTILNTTALLVVRLSEADLRLKVTVEQADVSIEDIAIQFSGNPTAESMNWILNSFKGEIQEALTKQLNDSLVEEAQEFFDQLFADAPLVIPLGSDSPLGVNYSLPLAPKVADRYLELYSLAVVVEIKDPVSNPPLPHPCVLPAFNMTGGQIQLSVSEYTLNSALYATVRAGLTDFTVTNQMVKGGYLNTNMLDNFLPGIKRRFGANEPCELHCNVARYPSIHMFSNGISGAVTFNCGIVVVSAHETAVQLALPANFTGNFELKNWTVIGSIQDIEIISVDVVSSALGININPTELKEFLNTMLKLVLPTLSNSIFNKGLPLPAFPGLNTTDSSLVIKEGYLYVEATPHYDFS
jgi:hypothetical protein